MIIKDWEKILSGQKTQHRVIVKKGEFFEGADPIDGYPAGVYRWLNNFAMSARAVYAVGKTYAVQPERGHLAVGRIRITGIRHEDVRTISDEDVLAEGHDLRAAFWLAWCEMNDKPAIRTWMQSETEHRFRDWLNEKRPAKRYDAWVLSFEVVRG